MLVSVVFTNLQVNSQIVKTTRAGKLYVLACFITGFYLGKGGGGEEDICSLLSGMCPS